MEPRQLGEQLGQLIAPAIIIILGIITGWNWWKNQESGNKK